MSNHCLFVFLTFDILFRDHATLKPVWNFKMQRDTILAKCMNTVVALIKAPFTRFVYYTGSVGSNGLHVTRAALGSSVTY